MCITPSNHIFSSGWILRWWLHLHQWYLWHQQTGCGDTEERRYSGQRDKGQLCIRGISWVFFLIFFWPSAVDRTAEDMTGNREREGGSDMHQRDPGRESNPGPLQSLGTWDARSTHWAKWHPRGISFIITKRQSERCEAVGGGLAYLQGLSFN